MWITAPPQLCSESKNQVGAPRSPKLMALCWGLVWAQDLPSLDSTAH